MPFVWSLIPRSSSPDASSFLVLVLIQVAFLIYAYREIRHAHAQWLAERERCRVLRMALAEAGISIDLEALEEQRKPRITIEVGVFCCTQGVGRLHHHGVPVTRLADHHGRVVEIHTKTKGRTQHDPDPPP